MRDSLANSNRSARNSHDERHPCISGIAHQKAKANAISNTHSHPEQQHPAARTLSVALASEYPDAVAVSSRQVDHGTKDAATHHEH